MWTTCLLFFQALLLAGYGYAHWLGSRRSVRLQASAHLRDAGRFAPVSPHRPARRSLDARVERRTLRPHPAPAGRNRRGALPAPVGDRSSSAALAHAKRAGQIALAALRAVELGSFLALLSYPFVLEPFLRLRTQVAIWSVLYAAFVALCGWTAWRLRATRRPGHGAGGRILRAAHIVDDPVLAGALRRRIHAAAGHNEPAFAGRSVNPFLWVAPLSIYLLTFILAFDNDRFYRRAPFAAAAGVLAPVGCIVQSASVALSLGAQIGLYLLALFVTCMLCQGSLRVPALVAIPYRLLPHHRRRRRDRRRVRCADRSPRVYGIQRISYRPRGGLPARVRRMGAQRRPFPGGPATTSRCASR